MMPRPAQREAGAGKAFRLLTLGELGPRQAAALVRESVWLKSRRPRVTRLAGRTMAMVFSKPSTRTRVSFEVAMTQLGGNAISLDGSSLQVSRGESLADTARTLSRYVDVIMARVYDHSEIVELADHASVPVINGLSNSFHPCQALADLVTIRERKGRLSGVRVAWVGDGNNVCNSLMHASALARMRLRIATPPGLGPDPATLKSASKRTSIDVGTDPQAAVEGADVVMTDTFSSIHDTDPERKRRLLRKYQVNDELMSLARKGAFFMHCLPAKRGEEVTPSVIDGPQSAVWDGAENRLHAQKALLLSILAKGAIS
ncbi:MAG: ornithine carbamoyltransferase [Thaumarchaeota archaeon]|nr:ornithine carbamoyltransferase [Nitrososphaerota archaeon]MDD9813274.1 ornithine carbamoyltransferase [Nitrososphaerota archaeon]MDD9842535.1 ornithine carbamoyltransferase [Nitrososphaerota archaeon]